MEALVRGRTSGSRNVGLDYCGCLNCYKGLDTGLNTWSRVGLLCPGIKVWDPDVGMSPELRSGPGMEVWALEGGIGPQVEDCFRGWTSGIWNGGVDYCGGWIPIKAWILPLMTGPLDGLIATGIKVWDLEVGLNP